MSMSGATGARCASLYVDILCLLFLIVSQKPTLITPQPQFPRLIQQEGCSISGLAAIMRGSYGDIVEMLSVSSHVNAESGELSRRRSRCC